MTAKVLGVAVASILLLSGCAPQPSAQPAPPTAAEQAEFLRFRSDGFWQRTRLPDAERPVVDVVRVVSKSEIEDAQTACFTALGVHPDDEPAAALVIYRCAVAYPVNPLEQGLVSADQHEFAWRYFTNWLVPCLELAGYAVHHAPSHGEFSTRHADEYHWNPYLSIATPTDDAVAAALHSRCPSSPFPDPNQSTG